MQTSASDFASGGSAGAEFDISRQTAAADWEIVRINTIGFTREEYAITELYQAQSLVQTARPRSTSLRAGSPLRYPGFPVEFRALANFMRLSLLKAAQRRC
jgi:hypothetical protein